MPFELERFTAVRLDDVEVLSQKNRKPDENLGAKLSIAVDVTNDSLAMFDGYLRAALYTKHGKSSEANAQIPLDGVQPVSDTPDLTNIGAHTPRIVWKEAIVGYALEIAGDIGKKSNLVIENCTADGWRLQPKAGGTVTVKFNVESNDVSAHAFGRLAKMKSRDISAKLTWHEPPADEQRDIEDDPVPTKTKAAKKAKAASPTPADAKPKKGRTMAQKIARAEREATKATARKTAAKTGNGASAS